MNYQYANGGTMTNALSTLWKEGGVPRFYRGVNYAIVQAPLSRFGDTFANTGVLALFEAFAPGVPVAAQTAVASVGGATWRIFLTPVDTLKTTLQVQGKEGMSILSQKIKKGGLGVMYNGAFANFGANWVGNYPWFTTFNYLQAKIPKPEDGKTLKKLGRNALIGVCASAVSDCVSNSLRVIKTVKQTNPDPNVGYVAGAKMIIEKEGIRGLLGRGLKARLITNILQSMVFSVAWKAIEEELNKPRAKKAAAVTDVPKATKAVWTLPPVAGLSMTSDAKAVCVSTAEIDQTQLAAPALASGDRISSFVAGNGSGILDGRLAPAPHAMLTRVVGSIPWLPVPSCPFIVI
eukprot:scaffold4057_cov390-Prasinococcus_capsulatus_cf.AAC.3